MECWEKLRLSTAKLKAKRLNLPHPGELFFVNQAFCVLTIVGSIERVFLGRGNILLLVAVNMDPPPHPNVTQTKLIDAVELIFMTGGQINSLVSTGTRAAADVMLPYKNVRQHEI